MKHEETVPFKLVPATGLFAFEGDVIVGKVNFRHRLNDFLLNVGGHIGYGVLPEFRGKGYASQMLKDSTQDAKMISILEEAGKKMTQHLNEMAKQDQAKN